MAKYTIKKGDTLYALAKKYLGDGNRWKELGYKGDPNKMPVGTVIQIPENTKKKLPVQPKKPVTKPVQPPKAKIPEQPKPKAPSPAQPKPTQPTPMVPAPIQPPVQPAQPVPTPTPTTPSPNVGIGQPVPITPTFLQPKQQPGVTDPNKGSIQPVPINPTLPGPSSFFQPKPTTQPISPDVGRILPVPFAPPQIGNTQQPQPSPTPQPQPQPGQEPITSQNIQVDYTKIPGFDKLTPQEQQMLRVLVDSIKSPIDLSNVPTFNFDEELARQSSTAEYQPYYGEKLQDVLNTVSTARQRAEQDYAKNLGMSDEAFRQTLESYGEQRIGLQNESLRALQDLQRSSEDVGLQRGRFEQDIAQQRSRGLRDIAESAAERGLTFSGIRGREEGQFTGDLEQARERTLQDLQKQQEGQAIAAQRQQQDLARSFENLARGEYGARFDYGQNKDVLAQSRTRALEDLQRQQDLAQRDIGREQTGAIESGVLQRRKEALSPYWYYFQKLAGTQN